MFRIQPKHTDFVNEINKFIETRNIYIKEYEDKKKKYGSEPKSYEEMAKIDQNVANLTISETLIMRYDNLIKQANDRKDSHLRIWHLVPDLTEDDYNALKKELDDIHDRSDVKALLDREQSEQHK